MPLWNILQIHEPGEFVCLTAIFKFKQAANYKRPGVTSWSDKTLMRFLPQWALVSYLILYLFAAVLPPSFSIFNSKIETEETTWLRSICGIITRFATRRYYRNPDDVALFCWKRSGRKKLTGGAYTVQSTVFPWLQRRYWAWYLLCIPISLRDIRAENHSWATIVAIAALPASKARIYALHTWYKLSILEGREHWCAEYSQIYQQGLQNMEAFWKHFGYPQAPKMSRLLKAIISLVFFDNWIPVTRIRLCVRSLGRRVRHDCRLLTVRAITPAARDGKIPSMMIRA